MSRGIDYVCEHCGHIRIARKSLAKRILTVAEWTLDGMIVLFAGIGILSIYNFSIDNNYTSELSFFSMGGFDSFILNNFQGELISSNDSYELKKIAINLSYPCADDYCKALKIYEYLMIYDENYNPNGTFQYKVGTDLDPIKIWNEKEGDCDELAFLYVSLLRELNINSKIQCNNNHCWAVLHIDNKTITADLTKFRFFYKEH